MFDHPLEPFEVVSFYLVFYGLPLMAALLIGVVGYRLLRRRNLRKTNNQPQTSLSKLGLRLGINLGFWFAIIYALVVSVLFNSAYAIPTPTLLGILGSIILLCAVGVFPAIIIGGLTGWLIGKIFNRSPQRLSHPVAFSLSLLICIGIALFLNVAFWTLQYIIFVPSIIYVAIGGYVGVRLNNEHLKTRDLNSTMLFRQQ